MNLETNLVEQVAEQGVAKESTSVLPMVRERKVDSAGRAHGVGKRKSSVAKIWISHGTGNFTINGKKVEQYFTRELYLSDVKTPLKVAGDQYDIFGVTMGGGLTGQAGAVRLAIARAMVNYNPDLYPMLRKAGLVTFDNRRVERKKPGLVKARKAKPTSRR